MPCDSSLSKSPLILLLTAVFDTCPSNKNTLSLGYVYCEPLPSVPPWQGSASLVTNHFQKGVELNLCAKKAIDFELLRSLDVIGSTFSPRFLLQLFLLNSKGFSRLRTGLWAALPSILGRIWNTMNYEISKSGAKGFESSKHLVSP